MPFKMLVVILYNRQMALENFVARLYGFEKTLSLIEGGLKTSVGYK